MAFRVVKIGSRPLLAMPAAVRSIHSASVQCYPGHTWKKRLVRSLIRAAFWLGLDRAVWADSPSPIDGIPGAALDAWIAEVRRALGDARLEPVVVWPANAARGRVYVYWLDPDGGTAAFCKLGLDARNSDLIHNEQSALETLAQTPLSRSRIPRVLAAGRLQGFAYLVVETAPRGARITRWSEDVSIAENVREYAGTMRRVSPRELEAMPWWARFAERCGCKGNFFRVVQAATSDGVEVCRVHGDLNHTNVLRADGAVWLLDWERSSDTGPCLTDAVCMEVDRLWPVTVQSPAQGLAAFVRGMWEGKNELHRQRTLLALAYLCAADFPPATALVKEWEPTLETPLQVPA